MAAHFLFDKDPSPCADAVRWRGGAARQARIHGVRRTELLPLARNAIFRALRAFGVGAGDEVLLPAYLCSAAVSAVAGSGARPVFYAVDERCRPDFASLEAQAGRRTRALLSVHYFGFPAPVTRLHEFCRRHSLLLIEDCAHVLAGETEGQALGGVGDASVFSWRKLLPLFDGGELLIRADEQSAVTTLRPAALGGTARAAKYLGEGFLRRPAAVAAQLLPASRLQQDDTATVSADPDLFDPRSETQGMTPVSRLMLLHSAIERAIARRRENYAYLAHALASMPWLQLLHPALPASVCPWVLPVLFRERPLAHRWLRARGIPATAWDGVRPAELAPHTYPAADMLYEQLVFLPVHQGLDPAHMDLTARAVSELGNSRLGR